MKANTNQSDIPDLQVKHRLAEKADNLLQEFYGEPNKKTSPNPLDQLILTILSQSTSDHNRDLAYARLKEKFPTWAEVSRLEQNTLAEAIRSGGLAKQKAERIMDILHHLEREKGELSFDWLGDIPVEEAIDYLTSFKGVGIKTAAVVLCFSFAVDIFPVDVHVHRICRRLGFAPENASAEKTHYLMQEIFPPGRGKSFHLNLLKLGRSFCRPQNPDCPHCPLRKICPYPDKTPH